MSKLSRNLSRWEFACKCGCGFDTVDVELVGVIQDVVDHFETLEGRSLSVTIDCGCRCPKHNDDVLKQNDPHYVAGTSKSQHMFGRAADIVVNGVSPLRVHDYLVNKYRGKYGIGKYRNFTHIDTRSGRPARW